MGAHFTPPPPAAISRVLARFDRDALAGFIAVAIDLMDVADGDPDLEANGDELDGNGGEDDFMDHWGDGPGCPIADPGGGNVEDEGEEIDEREPDNRGHCAHYGIDQSEPLAGYVGARVSIDALN